jgi:O-antigen/teichoic acid export membrane protein
MAYLVDVTPTEPETPAKAPALVRSRAVITSGLARDSLGYFGSKVVPGLIGLASVPVFIRLIGMEQYGRFAVIAPFLMAVAAAGSGWIAQGILRFHPLATDARQRKDIFDQAVRRGTVASVLTTSIALAMVLAGLRYSLGTVLISLSYCSSLLAYTVLLARFQAKLRPASVLRREIVRSIGCLGLPVVIVLLIGRKHFELVILGQAIAYTIALLPGFQFRRLTCEETPHRRRGHPRGASFSDDTIRELWRFGWAVGLWLLLSQALPVVDRWTIQRFASFNSAGIYASLYEIAIRSFSFLAFPLTQAAHPRIMRAWNEGNFAESYRIIRYSILSQFTIFGIVLAGVSLFAHRITKFILGFDDPAATRMLPVLLVGGFLWQLALLLHKPLEIAQRTGAMLSAMAVVVALNVLACFVFIPRFGYESASYILVFSACCYVVVTLGMTRFRALRRFSGTAETC